MLNYFTNYVQAKIKEEKGQGMVEYALLIALIAVVAIVGVAKLGPIISTAFTDISTKIAP